MRHYSYYVLQGEEAYEGMHILLRRAPDHDADGPWDQLYEGWIIESELPALPEPPSVAVVGLGDRRGNVPARGSHG